MPRINLPQRQRLAPIKFKEPKDFTDEIMQTQSYSPLAEAVTQFGKVASKGIEESAKRRQQLAELESLYKASLPAQEPPPLPAGHFPAGAFPTIPEQSDAPPPLPDFRSMSSESRAATINALRNKQLMEGIKTPVERKKEGLELRKLERDANAPYPAPTNVVIPGFTDENGNPVAIPNRGAPTPTAIRGLKPTVKPSNPVQDERQMGQVVDRFQKDQVVQKANNAIASGNQVVELITSGNPIAASAIPTYMARASGEVGNLSEADKRPFGGSQSIISRLEQSFNQAAVGRLSKENADFVKQLASTMQKVAIRNKQERARAYAHSYAKAYGKTPEEIQSMLLLDEELPGSPAPTPLPEPPSGVKKVGRFQVEVQ